MCCSHPTDGGPGFCCTEPSPSSSFSLSATSSSAAGRRRSRTGSAPLLCGGERTPYARERISGPRKPRGTAMTSAFGSGPMSATSMLFRTQKAPNAAMASIARTTIRMPGHESCSRPPPGRSQSLPRRWGRFLGSPEAVTRKGREQ